MLKEIYILKNYFYSIINEIFSLMSQFRQVPATIIIIIIKIIIIIIIIIIKIIIIIITEK